MLQVRSSRRSTAATTGGSEPSNYPAVRDGTIAEIDAGLTESEWVARAVGRPAIKAFNSITASSLATRGLPVGSPGRVCLPVAGDEQDAKARTIRMLEELGFDGLDAGSLAQSSRQQPGTAAYCSDLGVAELRVTLAEPDPHGVARRRLRRRTPHGE